MRVLVTGARGMLGRDLCPVLSEAHHVIEADQEEADITCANAVRRLVSDVRPELIVHAAAFTDVDGAESRPARAHAVNAVGTRHIVAAAAGVGARMVYISTDYVFDGSQRIPYVESVPPCPINVYGETKWEGERALPPGATVVRTSWLFAPHGRNFVNTILRLAGERDVLTVVTDQTGTPTCTLDLAHAIAAVIAAGLVGIVHVANTGPCSWFDFAAEILRQTGSSAAVKPCMSEQLALPAARPAYSALSTARLQRATGLLMRPWTEALADCLARRRQEASPPPHPRSGRTRR